MSSDSNTTTALRLFEAINGNDEATLRELIDPEVISHGVTERRGIDDYLRFFALSHKAFKPWTISVEETIAESDRVVLRITESGTMVGSYLGVPPTGKSYTLPAVQIARFAAGRLVEMWGFRDTMVAAQQLGLLPGGGH